MAWKSDTVPHTNRTRTQDMAVTGCLQKPTAKARHKKGPDHKPPFQCPWFYPKGMSKKQKIKK